MCHFTPMLFMEQQTVSEFWSFFFEGTASSAYWTHSYWSPQVIHGVVRAVTPQLTSITSAINETGSSNIPSYP